MSAIYLLILKNRCNFAKILKTPNCYMRIIKNLSCFVALIVLVLIFTGCVNSKHVAYFQGIDNVDLSASRGLYDARIMPKDELTIHVSTTDPAISAQFNLFRGGSSTGGANNIMPYLVENDGTINFPLVGRISVLGLTKRECEDKITSMIKPYLANGENPVVVVEMSGYHVTVIGAVGGPAVIDVSNNKISIIEALAKAGELNIQGKRDNLLLIREDAKGEKSAVRLNLNDPAIINSPYYYLQQNDVIYVEPNKVMAKNSDIGPGTTLWMSFVSFAVSIVTLFGVFKK